MYFVAVCPSDQAKPATPQAKRQINPSFILDFLNSLMRSITDFCGGLDEQLFRDNFVLIYEIIDEMIDFGFVQSTNNEALTRLVESKTLKEETMLNYYY